MLLKVRESEIASAIRSSNIRVISPAKRPLRLYKPRPGFNAGMGLMAGLFLSIAAVFVREQTDRSFKAPGDISVYLNLPELGVIPTSGREMTAGLIPRKGETVLDVESDGKVRRPGTTGSRAKQPELASWGTPWPTRTGGFADRQRYPETKTAQDFWNGQSVGTG